MHTVFLCKTENEGLKGEPRHPFNAFCCTFRVLRRRGHFTFRDSLVDEITRSSREIPDGFLLRTLFQRSAKRRRPSTAGCDGLSDSKRAEQPHFDREIRGLIKRLTEGRKLAREVVSQHAKFVSASFLVSFVSWVIDLLLELCSY